MNRTSRLLRKISATGPPRRDVSVNVLSRETQNHHMTVLPFKQLLLKNLRKGVSAPEPLTTTYLSLLDSMANPAAHADLNKATMDTFLDIYYNPTSSSNCEIPMTQAQDNLVCQNDVQTDVPLTLEQKHLMDKQRYKAMRKWVRFKKEKFTSNSEDCFILRLLSFNILAQHLLETYRYLYKYHDKEALPWEVRRPLLIQEILEAQANVICLQEMQEDHLPEFLKPFNELGYEHIYKKRTNDKKDGLLFLYRSDQLILLEHTKVELYQSGIELLSRDNVGIIAKLAVKSNPDVKLVIATTHLLYSPKRNDVRLGQTQLLLAEIERIAFIENTMTGPKYLPIILSGDFNLEPFTGVYRFITEGVFQYYGKGKNLEYSDFRRLSNYLIPPRLCVTDNCQHFNVLSSRLRGNGSGRVMLENSEQCPAEDMNSLNNSEVNVNTSDFQSIEIVRGCQATFSSGTLTHPFNLYSVYSHQNHLGQREATTNQGEWITVDYIFYSDVELLESYRIPTVQECQQLPTVPNFAVGSDHLCLGATFKIFKKKC